MAAVASLSGWARGARAAAGSVWAGRLCRPPRALRCILSKSFSKGSSVAKRPQRPLTAYLRFLAQQRSIFKKQTPDMKNEEIVKKSGEMWRELPEVEKQVYKNAANEDWEAYREEMAKYQAQLTPLQRKAMESEKIEKQAKRRASKKKRELTVFGKPKETRLPQNIFVSEHYQGAKGDSWQEKIKSLYEAWKNMPSSEKQVYFELAKEDKIRYENEMKIWEKQMIDLGRIDLLCVKSRRSKIKGDNKKSPA
ncbi:transcription factor A, mitochondrial-like [Tachyglossus aculeatus]|uniref:transcription factor A, mitochondrial-like n=1 Tax=Tachyglossus aculeatus TaxID=9261 RepID=UPI0018F466E3|nr:transcription factor A, mitochondrial-like [Tachyglossus aculeatus]